MVINSKTVETILIASSWKGESAPFTYDVTMSEIDSTTYAIEVAPSVDASTNQELSYMKAGLCGGDINDGTFTLQAYGKKPGIDIPIVVIVRGEI